ncbi:MAG: DUF1343 domain-containing protein [Candidatus Aerophobetes bacterium]|nr:DUF1343 domain-containing protein [Candidatus Aerophobetes bacterium]
MALKIKLGNEVLLEENIALIEGKRVGLVTNQTGLTGNLSSLADVLLSHFEVKLAALFGPEHGYRGDAQDGVEVESYIDKKTNLPVYSLFGAAKGPTSAMLKDIEIMLFDIQDIGVRYFTYIYTMANVIECAGRVGFPFVVLDRPNPLGGIKVEGNIVEDNFSSFVGNHALPIRHGMTIGELSIYFNEEFRMGADLKIIKMKNWQRKMYYDETSLIWVPPSPNMPALDTALVYPGTCLLEGTNISEGRGIVKPFEMIGAPWIDGIELSRELNSRKLPGVLFRPVYFSPSMSKYKNKTCQGVQFHIVNRDAFLPVLSGLTLLEIIIDLYPHRFGWREPFSSNSRFFFDLLCGTDKIRKKLIKGERAKDIVKSWENDLLDFKEKRSKYLLY